MVVFSDKLSHWVEYLSVYVSREDQVEVVDIWNGQKDVFLVSLDFLHVLEVFRCAEVICLSSYIESVEFPDISCHSL